MHTMLITKNATIAAATTLSSVFRQECLVSLFLAIPVQNNARRKQNGRDHETRKAARVNQEDRVEEANDANTAVERQFAARNAFEPVLLKRTHEQEHRAEEVRNQNHRNRHAIEELVRLLREQNDDEERLNDEAGHRKGDDRGALAIFLREDFREPRPASQPRADIRKR